MKKMKEREGSSTETRQEGREETEREARARRGASAGIQGRSPSAGQPGGDSDSEWTRTSPRGPGEAGEKRLQPPRLLIHGPPFWIHSLSLGCHRYVTHPRAMRTPGPCSRQGAPHSPAPGAHTLMQDTSTRVSACAHLPEESQGWKMLVFQAQPGYLSLGSHRKRLPELVEDVSGSVQPSKGFLFLA